MNLTLVASVSLSCALFSLATRDASGALRPEIAAAADAGQANAKRLPSSNAEWTTDIVLPNGAMETVATLHSPKANRYVITLSVGKNSQEIVRIIERGRIWYVQDGVRRAKYRAYEYPAADVLPYLGLVRSAPLFVSPESVGRLREVAAQDQQTATFRAPVPENIAATMRGVIERYEKLTRDHPDAPPSPETVRQIAGMKDFLARGVITVVDLSTGLAVEIRSPKLPTTTRGFRFLDHVEAEAFATEGNWDDVTSDPTAENTADLLMICNSPSYRLGMPKPDSDCMLFNAKTGRFRRVPFRGVVSMPGCFLKGRTQVVVCGADTLSGTLRPFIIDLKTGANEPVGSPILDSGATAFASLSPDGNRLAFTHIGGNAPLADVVVVDLRTGGPRSIARIGDIGPVHWAPDGRLVLPRRESRATNEPPESYVSILDLDGHVTDLRRGDQAVPLDDTRILYQDDRTQLWHTCDYQGAHDVLLADGLRQFGFPAPSPDGTRILMMKFQPGMLPAPTLLSTGQSDGTALTSAPGLWSFPAWK